MSVVLINQEIVHYEVLGRGRPVIFLHSWVGSWRYWIPSLQAASTNYRAYALDLWGFGETARSTHGFSLESQVGLLDQFLSQMGIGKIALVGHGLGAIVGLQFAALHPDLVDRVFAISCPLKSEFINERLHTDSSLELAGWLTNQRPELAAVVEDTAKIAPEVSRYYWEGVDDLRLQSLWQQCPSVCLMVQGLEDPAVRAADESLMLHLSDKIKYMYFTESGHFPMQDEDERFHRLMAEFLALPSGQSPRALQMTESWRRRVR
jgi:pimeloyl-ACP methyl ester carboxylesterase